MSDETPRPHRLIAAVGERADGWPVDNDLVSATDRTPYWLREDPYHDGWMWDHPPTVAPRWVHHREYDEYGRIHMVQQPNFLALDSDEGRRAWSRARNSEHIHRMLALLNAFRHATSKQLHAATTFGWKQQSKYLKPMYELGLVQRGKFQLQGRVAGALPYVYALNNGPRLSRLLGELDDATARRITGNDERKIFTSGRHVRHDMLTYELILRTLEVQPAFIAVAGEHLSSPKLLLPGAKGMPTFEGDATLYREDGLRVVIEMAASRNASHLEHTVTKWAQILAGLPRQDSGLVVVIVNAHRTRHGNMAKNLRRILSQTTTPGTLRHRNGSTASPEECRRARAQIHLASWVDWYPNPQSISTAGRNLHTVATPDGDRWVSFALADPSSYGYEPRPGREWGTPTAEESLVIPPWAGVPPLNTPDLLKASPALGSGLPSPAASTD